MNLRDVMTFKCGNLDMIYLTFQVVKAIDMQISIKRVLIVISDRIK